MAAVYLKNLLLKFLSYSYDAGYCWEDVSLSLHGALLFNYTELANFRHLRAAAVPLFRPRFPSLEFCLRLDCTDRNGSDTDRNESGKGIAIRIWVFDFADTYHTASYDHNNGSGRFGIPPPWYHETWYVLDHCEVNYKLKSCRASRRYLVARRLSLDGPTPIHIPHVHDIHVHRGSSCPLRLS